MLHYTIITAVAVAIATSAQPKATIQKPKALTVTGGRCQLKEDGTLGVNIGPNAAMPTVAFTVGLGAFMADQMHANKAKFTGPGKYANEIIALYLGKTALQDSYIGLGIVTVAADKKSGLRAETTGRRRAASTAVRHQRSLDKAVFVQDSYRESALTHAPQRREELGRFRHADHHRITRPDRN